MTTTGNSGAPAVVRRAPRWMKIVLVASLAFNLLTIGMIGRAAYHHIRGEFGFGGPERSGFRMFVRHLPEAQRQEVRAIIEKRRNDMRALREGLQQARSAMREQFKAVPFDPAAFRTAHSAMVAAEAKLREARHAVFPEIVERLTPEERRRLSELQERREHRHRRWRPSDSDKDQ